MRKYYIDNLRWATVLLLFPFHTARIYDSIETFYVKGEENQFFSIFIEGCSIWFMPLLFVLAGISVRYSLEKRSLKEFFRERFLKLFIPLISGILLVVPLQGYIANKFHNSYEGSYFLYFSSFFTKITDLTGYDGGFTPAHLWFILYLLIISFLAYPFLIWKNKEKFIEKYFEIILFIAIIPIFLCSFIVNIEGKSLGGYYCLFILGYLVLSYEKSLEYLEKKRLLLLALAMLTVILTFCININSYFDKFIYLSASWFIILTIIGFAKKYFDFANNKTEYLSKSSYAIYIFHQTWIIIVGYLVLKWFEVDVVVSYSLIMILSIIITFLTYEITKRFSITRFMFGIK